MTADEAGLPFRLEERAGKSAAVVLDTEDGGL